MMILVLKGQDFICPCYNPALLFISKAHDMKWSHTTFQDVDSIISQYFQRRIPDCGHTCLQEKLTEII